VQVLEVRTQVCRGKWKRLGRWRGRRPTWKKAIVTLAPGQTIDFFEGV
jgi:large subunit ribosomal protein L23